jgi:hypothetical protein
MIYDADENNEIDWCLDDFLNKKEPRITICIQATEPDQEDIIINMSPSTATDISQKLNSAYQDLDLELNKGE